MNTDQLTPVVRRWLRHTEATPPDAYRSARQVMARMPYVRQRSRWWPLPLLGRRTSSALSGRDREQRFADIPDTTYRIPTVTGRTRLMFSPVKAIIAGALVFTLGGVFLIAQPFDQQGSVPGAEQGAEPPVWVEVTEALGLGGCEESTEASHVCEVLHEWSDPQLQGTSLTLRNSSFIEVSDAVGGELGVFNDIYIIESERGTWRMRPQMRFEFEGAPELQEGPWWWVLDGDGDHEGLSLLLIRGDGEKPPYGFIVSTDQLPPAPEGASTK